MLVPTRISVDVSAGEELVEVRCARCGHLAYALVSGGGTGLTFNGVSVSNARLDAQVGAAQAARLAPCPRCGHRDRVALAKVLLLGASIGALAALAAGLVAAEQLRGTAADGLGVHVAAAAFLGTVVVTTALKLRSVRRRVRFQRVAV